MPTSETSYRSPSKKAVQALRKTAGWGVGEAAARLRVDHATWKAWESGKEDMHPGLFRLMVVLAVYELAAHETPTGEGIRNLRTGLGWTQAEIRYYIFALLFVMFDVEAVFIFPWATRLEAYGTFGVVEMSVFIAVLALGLLYAWRKKVLRWI